MARVPARARLELVCDGSSGQGGTTHLAPLETTRYEEHYIKVFDRTVVEAVDKMQAQIEALRKAKGDRQQLELRFDDGQPATSASECPMDNGFPRFSTARPAVDQQIFSSWVESD